jgi:hypothetical protein
MEKITQNNWLRNLVLILVLGFVHGLLALPIAYLEHTYVGFSSLFANWIAFSIGGLIITVPLFTIYTAIVLHYQWQLKLGYQILLMTIFAAILCLFVILREEHGSITVFLLKCFSIFFILMLYVILNYKLAWKTQQ